MGVVYRAMHLMLGRPVAVKVIREDLMNVSNVLQRFMEEARRSAAVKHPNAVEMYDFDQDKETERLYLVMEYIQGDTLEKIIKKRGALPWQEAIRIAVQVCDVLAEAHEKGIIHRDLKPANIMVGPRQGVREDRVTVMDFGISKALTDREGLTSTGILIGTPHFMSPEQAEGLRDMDGRSDIYSLGIILYQMLSGEVPFDADTTMAILLKHIKDPPPPLIHKPRAKEIPLALEKIVMKCLEKKREARFRNAQELRHALEMVESEAPDEVIIPACPECGEATDAPRFTCPRCGRQNLCVRHQTKGGLCPSCKEQPRRFNLRIATAVLGAVAVICLLVIIAYLITGRGRLEVAFEPKGAHVLVSGKDMGLVPLHMTLRPGTYQVEIRMEGYRSHHEEVRVTRGKSAAIRGFLQEEITAKAGPRIETTPSGAKVYLDGKAIDGRTPIVLGELSGGKTYNVKIEKEGYAPKQLEISLKEGEEKPLTVVLDPLVGSIYVGSTPPGAIIILDDSQLDELTPCLIEKVPIERSHRLELNKPGFKPYIISVKLEDTGTKRIAATLIPMPTGLPDFGRFYVTSSPPGATVYYDDVKQDKKTPLRIENVTLGQTHVVRMEKAGYAPWEQSYTLKEAVEKTVHADLPPQAQVYGRLLINSEPWTDVYLDNQQKGTTPLDVDMVPSGRHEVRLVRSDLGIDKRFSVEVGPKAQAKKVFRFTGYLTVLGRGSVSVYVDDHPIGKTPIEKKELVVGAYRLKLRHDEDKREKEFNIIVENEKTLTIDKTF